jgi:chromate reductase, NAD(P)H dehydrogenase (quinone)
MKPSRNHDSFKVAALVGSLRKESFSRKVANALIDLATPPLSISIVEIGNLPLFNQDAEEKPPQAWTEFRKRVQAAEAVLFVTPEYNRSISAVLKNAIDVGSRPSGKSIWNGMPGGVVSVTPYTMGAFGANHHLRQSLVYLNVPAMQQPEAYISHADKLFDGEGKLDDESTRKFFVKYLAAFAAWIAANARDQVHTTG